MRFSDWSSDVCSPDLLANEGGKERVKLLRAEVIASPREGGDLPLISNPEVTEGSPCLRRGSQVGERAEERRVGKECAGRVDIDGRRIIQKKKTYPTTNTQYLKPHTRNYQEYDY